MSTICPRCNGSKVVVNPNWSWVYDQMTWCRRCSGTGVYVSRAHAGLRAPTPLGWLSERIVPIVRNFDQGVGGIMKASSPTGRSLERAFLPSGEYILPSKVARWARCSASFGEPDEVSSMREAVQADLETSRLYNSAVMHAAFQAALDVDIPETKPTDIVGRIGGVEVTRADLESWQARLAQAGVVISVVGNHVSIDFESSSGVIPGDYSKLETLVGSYRRESLPVDNKPNPKPKKGAGYQGDWKQGQRRKGRR